MTTSKSTNAPFSLENNPKEYHRLMMVMLESCLTTLYKRGYDELKRILLNTQLRTTIYILDDGTLPRDEVICAVERSLISRYNESADYLGKERREYKDK